MLRMTSRSNLEPDEQRLKRFIENAPTGRLANLQEKA